MISRGGRSVGFRADAEILLTVGVSETLLGAEGGGHSLVVMRLVVVSSCGICAEEGDLRVVS